MRAGRGRTRAVLGGPKSEVAGEKINVVVRGEVNCSRLKGKKKKVLTKGRD